MKAWLATAVVLLACLQVFTATWMYEKLPFGARPWIPTVHKVSGTLAGCCFYGAFTAKMLWLRVDGLPGVVLPIVGGSVLTMLVVIWLTSSLWFFDNFGFPSF
jgi:hypothetical protein